MDPRSLEARVTLCQRWLHSFEEDTETEAVYRPATFAFPLARGRNGFELGLDDSCLYLGIGATDRTEELAGNWELADTPPRIRLNCGGFSTDLKVTSLEPDRLVIKK